ncbi:hypothetical protein HMPREF9716_02575, partial [Myroides odoratus CIP 103059]
FEQGAHCHVPVRIYRGKRFFAFLQGAFLENESNKRRISFEKDASGKGRIAMCPYGRGKIFLFFDALLIYIGRDTWSCALSKRKNILQKYSSKIFFKKSTKKGEHSSPSSYSCLTTYLFFYNTLCLVKAIAFYFHKIST